MDCEVLDADEEQQCLTGEGLNGEVELKMATRGHSDVLTPELLFGLGNHTTLKDVTTSTRDSYL